MNKTIAFVIHHVDFIENLGIAYLSSVAKQRGWSTELIVFNRATVDQDFQRINPAIVAYSAMSADASVYLEINTYLKSRYSFISVMGGAHPTYFPDIRFTDGIDYICRGEGDLAFGEFLEKIEAGESIEGVQNFGSATFLNPLRPLVENLDDLPFPDRDLVFRNTELGQSNLKIFMTHRGCPFTCTYCYNNPLNQMQAGLGKRSRSHSPARVIAEIEDVRRRYPLTFIKFQDDLFAPKTSWLAEFAPLYAQRVGLPFNVLERIDLINEERLKWFRVAGCKSLTFAIDSANQRVRQEILKRGMRLSNEEIIQRLNMVHDSGIHSMINFILGVPTAAVQDELDAVELAIRGKVGLAITSTLVPYPGTEIYNYVTEHKLLDRPTTVEENKRDIVALAESNDFSSIQKRSILNCFSEKEKDVLENIASMFSAMVALPVLRPFLIWAAYHLKPNPALYLVAILAKAYKVNKYIYPTPMSIVRRLGFLFKALRIEGSRMMGLKKQLS